MAKTGRPSYKNAPHIDGMLTLAETASLLGITTQGAAHLVSRNKVNSVKIGSFLYIPVDDIESYQHNRYKRTSFPLPPTPEDRLASLTKRVWSKIDKSDTSNCWYWTGTKDKDGYGRIGYYDDKSDTRKTVHVTRLVYEFTYGPFDPALNVLHKCDNTSCCNPSHLFLGTTQDNVNDRESKGRSGKSYGKRPKPDRYNAFINRVNQGGNNECWLWTGPTHKDGYGSFNYDQTKTLAHRVAYEVWNSAIPDGMVVMHVCNNRLCCNPKHLSLGTQSDVGHSNTQKGNIGKRTTFGESHYKHKLTEKDVVEIRNLSKQGVKQRTIALMFGVHQSAIWSVIHRKSWRHIP